MLIWPDARTDIGDLRKPNEKIIIILFVMRMCCNDFNMMLL